MAILVTGGAGFVGYHACAKLLEKGKEVICYDDLDAYYDVMLKKKHAEDLKKKGKEKFHFYHADITSNEELSQAFQKHQITEVVHLAALAGVLPSINDPVPYTHVNINGLQNVLELSRKNNVKKIVFASSSSVYGARTTAPFKEEDKTDFPLSPYGATKKAGEVLCYTYHHLYKIPIVCLRFFTVYGPGGRPDMAVYKFTEKIDAGEEIPVYGNGSSKRDYTYVEDVADALVAALHADLQYEIINLGNEHPIELNYLISLIEKELGKKALKKFLPEQAGDVQMTCASIEKAKRLIGYHPKVMVEEGIKRFVEWYRKDQKAKRE